MSSHTANHEAHGHRDELKTYWAVLISLMVLLVVTIVASFIHFGNLANPIIALTIAFVKAFLVIWFFMHVRHSRHLVWVFAAGGFFFLSILVSAVLLDVESRGWGDNGPRSAIPSTGPEMERLPGPFEILMEEEEKLGGETGAPASGNAAAAPASVPAEAH